MPPTEQCLLGIENKTRIIGLEKAVDEIKEGVGKLINHYSQRPTKTMLRMVAIMAGLLGTSIGVNAVLIALIVKMVS